MAERIHIAPKKTASSVLKPKGRLLPQHQYIDQTPSVTVSLVNEESAGISEQADLSSPSFVLPASRQPFGRISIWPKSATQPVTDLQRAFVSASIPSVDSILNEMDAGVLNLNDATKWEALASHSEYLKTHESRLSRYFKDKIDADLITFDTITEEQRKVFSLISATDKENLRKSAIQKSRLFQVLTEMQLQTNDAAERARIVGERMSSAKVGDYYLNSLAAMFARYEILPEMLVAEVTNLPIPGNEPIARYVRKLKHTYSSEPDKIIKDLIDKTRSLACGLGNTFALAASRGKVGATVNGAKKWLKENILDKPPNKALVQISQGRFYLYTSQVLTDLSLTGKQPTYTAERVLLTQTNSAALFQKAIKKSAGERNARLGIVQGHGKSGHMYIIYKDLDGIWRTMDMYLSIADRPGGGLPSSEEYATEKQWHKLVVD